MANQSLYSTELCLKHSLRHPNRAQSIKRAHYLLSSNFYANANLISNCTPRYFPLQRGLSSIEIQIHFEQPRLLLACFNINTTERTEIKAALKTSGRCLRNWRGVGLNECTLSGLIIVFLDSIDTELKLGSGVRNMAGNGSEPLSPLSNPNDKSFCVRTVPTQIILKICTNELHLRSLAYETIDILYAEMIGFVDTLMTLAWKIILILEQGSTVTCLLSIPQWEDLKLLLLVRVRPFILLFLGSSVT
ncbi:hypothetical protein CEXT_750801 [Caerostris extrusa]|uniref:Uncharacterized protein n=1 Tax=Caerostris extrusa TaxID=172846 RepID=A0AAV4NZC2_CAEEX|nr:hypothetical protein CEXT_750801 [Caerostris extrusa]